MKPIDRDTKDCLGFIATFVGIPTIILIVAGVFTLTAAPRGRPEPPPDPPVEDRVAGTFGRSLNAPIVTVVDDAGKAHTIWLVFPSPAVEAVALRELAVGAPVVAVGRVQCGGPYAYVIVYRLETP